MVRNRARKTRKRDLAVEVTRGESRQGNSQIGNDSNGENVETATHGNPPGNDMTAYRANIADRRAWAVFTNPLSGKN